MFAWLFHITIRRLERSHSGLVRHLGKVVDSQGSRGFESRPLRQAMKQFAKYFSVTALCATGIFLIALQIKPWAWLIYTFGLLSLLLAQKQFAKQLLLIYIAFLFLGITPITTDISWGHIAVMSATLALAVAVPFLISRYIYKDKKLITFKFRMGRHWLRKEIGYI